MDQKIINLYDSYTHSQISRKDFMKKLAILTGSTALALTILPSLEATMQPLQQLKMMRYIVRRSLFQEPKDRCKVCLPCRREIKRSWVRWW